jgi:hypothetical protein
MEKNNNELIAEFMGLHRQEPGEYNKVSYWKTVEKDKRKRGDFVGYYDSMKYDTSWDWLMPVVQKIEGLYEEDFPPDFVQRLLAKQPTVDHHYMDVIALPLATPINEAYAAVVEFIKWYNSINKSSITEK